MGVGVRAADPANHSGDVAVEVEETGGGHCLPVFTDGSDVVPVGLESLEGSKIDASIFFEQLLELAGTEGSTLEYFKVAARDEAAFDDGEEDVAEAFGGVERMG